MNEMFMKVKKIELPTEAIKITKDNVLLLNSMGFIKVVQERRPDGNCFFSLSNSPEGEHVQHTVSKDSTHYAVNVKGVWSIISDIEFQKNYEVLSDKPKFTRSRSKTKEEV